MWRFINEGGDGPIRRAQNPACSWCWDSSCHSFWCHVGKKQNWLRLTVKDISNSIDQLPLPWAIKFVVFLLVLTISIPLQAMILLLHATVCITLMLPIVMTYLGCLLFNISSLKTWLRYLCEVQRETIENIHLLFYWMVEEDQNFDE